jgi:hypothetical protein
VLALPAAAHARPGCPGDPGETNGELFDVGPRFAVIGQPSRDLVRMRRDDHWELIRLGGAAGGFGASVATGELDGDSCFDMVVGAPGRNLVAVIHGARRSADGERVVLDEPDAQPGDRFGAAVALSGGDGFQPTDLWVGAPGRDVAGQADAGAIYHYAIDSEGNASFSDMLTQGMPGVGDAPERGDRLGELLTPLTRGVVAGVPHEDVGAKRDAGAVDYIRTDGKGRHVPGRAAGDRFGAAVYGHGDGAWVGAPGRDVHGVRDAGVVQDVRRTRSGRQIAQESPHRGNRFGSAIASGAALRCQEDSGVAVGAPGEDHRSGTVTILQVDDETGCDPVVLKRGHGLPGTPRRGERLGAHLGITPDLPGLDEDTYDTLLISARRSVLAANSFDSQAPWTLRVPGGGSLVLQHPTS